MKNLFICITLLISSCGVKKSNEGETSPSVLVDGALYTSYFQQKSAEYRALCFQSYNIARLRLMEDLKHRSKKPRAIITDIDETVLDNSPYAVHQAMHNKEYNDSSWYAWTDMAKADTVPGAASFLKFAASKGVQVFYITNRKMREKASTLINLQKFNLPFADSMHLMVRTDPANGSKEERRHSVLEHYNVILFLGDNLADFSALFDNKSVAERMQNTNNSITDFGSRFIVLPNPVYGDWEAALFNYYKDRPSSARKDSILKNALAGY